MGGLHRSLEEILSLPGTSNFSIKVSQAGVAKLFLNFLNILKARHSHRILILKPHTQ